MKIFFSLLVSVFFYLSCTAQKVTALKITDVVHLMENKDSVIIINFWATFCAPCVAEIPDLIKYASKYKKQKVKLYLVSLDLPENYPKKIQSFISKKKYVSNFRWLNETNADYFCPLIDANWSGSIPATIIINNKTGFKQFWEKQLTATEIENGIKDALAEKN